MAYVGQQSTVSNDQPLDKEAVANALALKLREGTLAVTNTAKVTSRGFWNGLLGRQYVSDDVLAAAVAQAAKPVRKSRQ